jgi:hypothetical protein
MRFSNASKIIWSKFHTKNQQVLGATARCLVAAANWGPCFVLPSLNLLRHFNVFHELSLDIFVICNWVDTRWQQYSTQLHRNSTQNNTINLGRVRAVPRLCKLYPGICLTTEEKARKNLSHGSRRVPVGTMETEYTEQNIHNNKNT